MCFSNLHSYLILFSSIIISLGPIGCQFPCLGITFPFPDAHGQYMMKAASDKLDPILQLAVLVGLEDLFNPIISNL